MPGFLAETALFLESPNLGMQGPDHTDFEKLFKKHRTELNNLAYNLIRDRDAAKDVVQEVFLKLWKNRGQLTFGEEIRNYLFKATAHTAINHLRFNKKILKTEDDAILLNIAASADVQDIGFKELEWRVREAIDRLPAKCKAIYMLSRHEGMKYQEIADTLNLSLKTVENQMGIALEKLRNELKPFLSTEFLTLIAFLISGHFLLFY